MKNERKRLIFFGLSFYSLFGTWKHFPENMHTHSIKINKHSFKITHDMSALSLLESRDKRYIKAINNHHHHHHHHYHHRASCSVMLPIVTQPATTPDLTHTMNETLKWLSPLPI